MEDIVVMKVWIPSKNNVSNVFGHYRDKYRFYACLLRARFDDNKNEKDMIKATMMLKAGEEEFWANQHPQPYIFPESPGGTSYERYECYKVGPWESPINNLHST